MMVQKHKQQSSVPQATGPKIDVITYHILSMDAGDSDQSLISAIRRRAQSDNLVCDFSDARASLERVRSNQPHPP